MDLFISQGFANIGCDILQYLDNQSLCQSRLVCTNWARFITCERFWHRRIIKKGKNSRFCQSDEWHQVFDSFSDSDKNLSDIVRHFFSYVLQHNNEIDMDEELYNYPYHVPVMTQNLVDISQLWHYINKSDIYGLAAEQGQDLVVNYIIDEIVDKNPKIPNQKLTLLHCVAYHGHSQVAQCIVNNILDKNPKAEDGRTPLHFAAAKGHLETVKIFLNVIKDKNPVSHYGRTPLHYAAEAGHLNVVKCILDRISDKNPKDTEGRTPLHFAARQGHVQVVQCIMDRITYKNPRDKRGRTPLWYATENSHTEVIKSIIV